MHNGNVVVQQPLSASSVISAACVSVAVVYICKKKLLTQKSVNNKFSHCCWQLKQPQAKKNYFPHFCLFWYGVK